jgi:hypothetical protein
MEIVAADQEELSVEYFEEVPEELPSTSQWFAEVSEDAPYILTW